LVTLREKRRLNVAVMVRSSVMVTTHGAVPGQLASLHPVNADPSSGVAVSVTGVIDT
jgi:hypothetical protein